MAATETTDLRLSLKPWGRQARAPAENSIASTITRIHNQYGHFRDVSEASLSAELEKERQEAAEGSKDEDTQMEGVEGEGEGGEVEVDASKKLKETKLQMIEHTRHALNEALLAQDFVSLLVSLQAPEIGTKTMSPALKAATSGGSLGFDRIQRKPDPALDEEDRIVARQWKIGGLRSAASSLMAASNRLKAESDKEARYWEHIMAIRDEGWMICRMSRERNTLGVRFGFSEAAPRFCERGVGALRMGKDGSVRMDDVDVNSLYGGVAVRVRVFDRNGQLVGESSCQFASKSGDDGECYSLKDTIERRRDLIYEEELFFEIMREARSLASQGIRTSEDAAIIELGEGRSVVIDMAPLEEVDRPPNPANPENFIAQSIAWALRILLSYNHTLHHLERTQVPQPLTVRKPPNKPLQLIAPVLFHLYHEEALRGVQRALSDLQGSAKVAGRDDISFKIFPRVSLKNISTEDVKVMVNAFLHTIETEVTVDVGGGTKLDIMMGTTLAAPYYGTVYRLKTTENNVPVANGEHVFYALEELVLYLQWRLDTSYTSA